MAVERVEAAYRAIHVRLWRSLLAYTGHPEIASDAESEAFAQALRRGQAIDDVEAWVWRSAFRIAAGILQRRGTEVSLDQVQSGGVVLPEPVVELLDLLGCLSPQQRSCVALRYLGAYEAPEIAELLDTTSGTVRVQLHRAHQTLRDALHAEMQEDT